MKTWKTSSKLFEDFQFVYGQLGSAAILSPSREHRERWTRDDKHEREDSAVDARERKGQGRTFSLLCQGIHTKAY